MDSIEFTRKNIKARSIRRGGIGLSMDNMVIVHAAYLEFMAEKNGGVFMVPAHQTKSGQPIEFRP